MDHKQRLEPFRNVWGASGVQNIFPDAGWPYHHWWRRIFGWFFSFKGLTSVAKTVTADHRDGNMPLKDDGVTPKEFFPACIVANLWQFLLGVMLNAVGLSNRGVDWAIREGKWQALRDPFMISVMAVGRTREERREEMNKITRSLQPMIRQLRAVVGIQLNVSCPNTEHRMPQDSFVEETFEHLDILSVLGVPIMVKINILTAIEDGKRITNHPACSGLVVGNTIPWAAVPKWLRILCFGRTTSPLAHLGGGGLSGRPLLPRICAWIREARAAGITKHINACGGILGPLGVWRAKRAGADSVSLGTIAALRPWMLQITIRFANWLYH